MDHSEQKRGVPLRQDWIAKAEYELEALRKRAEMERDSIPNEFHAWPNDDVRRWTISRLSTIFFMPFLGLYIMRVHLSYPEWWEEYANGAPLKLCEDGRTEFDRQLKGKLLIDLAGNLEHSFRLILKQLDPQTYELLTFPRSMLVCFGRISLTCSHLRLIHWQLLTFFASFGIPSITLGSIIPSQDKIE